MEYNVVFFKKRKYFAPYRAPQLPPKLGDQKPNTLIRTSILAPILNIGVAFAIALVVAPVIRSTTIVLNDTVGRLWPFSLIRCDCPTSPGCESEPSPFAALRVRGVEAGPH
jgi:hypothetical protein